MVAPLLLLLLINRCKQEKMKQEIVIDDWTELVKFIQNTEINVRWQIKSDIGPGWVGRGKIFNLSSNNRRFKKNNFHLGLIEKLSRSLLYLEKYKDHTLDGVGKIFIEDKVIKFKYSWEGTIPYQYPDKTGKGEEILIALAKCCLLYTSPSPRDS